MDSERRATKRALGADDTAVDDEEEEEEEARTTAAPGRERRKAEAGTGGGERSDAAIGRGARRLPAEPAGRVAGGGCVRACVPAWTVGLSEK